MPVHLTDRFVAAARAKKRANIADDVVPGLRLRVSPSGAKSWAVYYRLRGSQDERLYTLGQYPVLSLGRAREEARRILARARLGEDPQGALVHAREVARALTDGSGPPRFGEICDEFLKDQARDWRPVTRASWSRYVEREIKPNLGDKIPHELQPSDVREFVDRIKNGVAGAKPDEWARRPAPVSAQRAYEVLRRILAWAVWKGRLAFSPCEQAKPFERAKRSGRKGRVRKKAKAYSNDQLQRLFAAAKSTEIEVLLDLIARTGTRSHEARAARWEDFDLTRGIWTIPTEMQKAGGLAGEPHVVPLAKGALAALKRLKSANQAGPPAESGWLFPAATTSCETCTRPGHMDKPNRASAAVKRAAGINDRGLLHRFRDTLKTRLSEHGVEGRVSEHILGHVVPGIAGIYDHAELLPQRREALRWWDRELDRILAAKPDSRASALSPARQTASRREASREGGARRRNGRPSPSPDKV
jgi:integrase